MWWLESENEDQDRGGIDCGDLIICHNPQSTGQFFEPADWPRLGDVKQSEQQKSREQSCPREVDSDPDQREGGDFVPDDAAWVFALSQRGGSAAQPDAGQKEQQPDESAEDGGGVEVPEQPADG